MTVEAYDETRVVLRMVDGLTVLEIKDASVGVVGNIKFEPYEMKAYTFSFVNRGKVLNCGCLLFRDNSIKKYSVGVAGFACDSELHSDNKLVVDMFLLRMRSEAEHYDPEFVVTVDSTLRLDFYDLFGSAEKPLLTYWPEGRSEEVSVMKILFDRANNELWVQRGQAGVLCVQFRR